MKETAHYHPITALLVAGMYNLRLSKMDIQAECPRVLTAMSRFGHYMKLFPIEAPGGLIAWHIPCLPLIMHISTHPYCSIGHSMI